MADKPGGVSASGTLNAAFKQANEVLYGQYGPYDGSYPSINSESSVPLPQSQPMTYYPVCQNQPQQFHMSNNNNNINNGGHQGNYTVNAAPSTLPQAPQHSQQQGAHAGQVQGQGTHYYIVEMLQQMNRQFSSRFTNLEQSLSTLSTMKNDLSQLRVDVSTLKTEKKQITAQVSDLEKAAQVTSDVVDDYMDNKRETETAIRNLRDDMEGLKSCNSKLMEENVDLKEKCLEMQSRMMEQNLLFFGLQEDSTREETRDTTENMLRDFMRDVLKFEGDMTVDDIEFDRVHRLGRRRFNRFGNLIRPRPIVARFQKISQREA